MWTHDSGGDIALHMCVCPSVCPSVTLLVKVFKYGYISVTINGIAFIFDIQLSKDLGNTILGYFGKTKYFFIVNLGVLDVLDKIWVF